MRAIRLLLFLVVLAILLVPSRVEANEGGDVVIIAREITRHPDYPEFYAERFIQDTPEGREKCVYTYVSYRRFDRDCVPYAGEGFLGDFEVFFTTDDDNDNNECSVDGYPVNTFKLIEFTSDGASSHNAVVFSGSYVVGPGRVIASMVGVERIDFPMNRDWRGLFDAHCTTNPDLPGVLGVAIFDTVLGVGCMGMLDIYAGEGEMQCFIQRHSRRANPMYLDGHVATREDGTQYKIGEYWNDVLGRGLNFYVQDEVFAWDWYYYDYSEQFRDRVDDNGEPVPTPYPHELSYREPYPIQVVEYTAADFDYVGEEFEGIRVISTLNLNAGNGQRCIRAVIEGIAGFDHCGSGNSLATVEEIQFWMRVNGTRIDFQVGDYVLGRYVDVDYDPAIDYRESGWHSY